MQQIGVFVLSPICKAGIGHVWKRCNLRMHLRSEQFLLSDYQELADLYPEYRYVEF